MKTKPKTILEKAEGNSYTTKKQFLGWNLFISEADWNYITEKLEENMITRDIYKRLSKCRESSLWIDKPKYGCPKSL